MKNVKRLSLILLATTLLASCGHVEIPDIKIYSVAGDLQAGADFVHTGHDEIGEVSMHEIVKILEDGAIIMSSQDFKRNKTAIEQACYKLGKACSYEVRKAITDFNRRSDQLRKKAVR